MSTPTKSSSRPAAKRTPAARKPVTPSAAPAKRTAKAVAKPAAKKVPAKRKTAPAKTTAKRSTKTATVVPSIPRQRTAAPRPRTARQPKPLLHVVRRPDGRALSFVERLAEAMHKRLGHDGAVCHRCRVNASQLASVARSA